MLYACTPECVDPTHRHTAARYARAAKSAGAAKVAKLVKKPAKRAAGASPRIDMHCHYLNAEVADRVVKHIAPANANENEPGWRFATPFTRETNVKQHQDRWPMLTSIPRRLKDMDKMGVDIQAVSPAPSHYQHWLEAGFAAECVRSVNEGIAKVVADTPDRFVGLGMVPLQNAELAVKELDYAVKTLGLKGIEINTNVNGKNLTDPELGLEKLFARAQELDVVIFMHPNGFSEATRLSRHYFNNIIGNPLDTTVAVHHLIFDGVMERNPKLKIVLAHSGGFIGHYWARIDHGHKARPDTKTVIKKAPSSYLKRFYFDTICFDPEMLKNSIDKWGADHVVIGTDYPYDMGMYNPLEFVDSVKGLSKADRDLIKGGNAARLLKIER